MAGRAMRIGVGVVCVGVVVLALALAAFDDSAGAAPGESDVPIANPDLAPACGLDVNMVLDESSSVAPVTNDVRNAFRAFTSAIKNTGSRMAVSEFSTVARLPIGKSYVTVTDATVSSTFEPYISTGYVPNGRTNWEDGFRVPRYFQQGPSSERPPLVVYITDGDPNEVVNNAQVTYDPGNPNVAQNEYELKVPLSDSEATSTDATTAKNRAVSNANALKARGSHVLVIAVGSALNNPSSLSRIIDISGPDVFSGSGAFDIATTDVYRVVNFSDLEAALRKAAFALCAPSVTVRKLVDMTPDPGTNDLVPAPGWQMTTTASPTPAKWVLPGTGTGSTASLTTDDSGFATFQWTTALPVASTIAVSEQDPGSVPPGFTNDPASTACTSRTPDQPADKPLPVDATDGGFSAVVSNEAIVTCRMVNRAEPAPGIDLEKYTNGSDADTPPGPFIPVTDDDGNPTAILWTYTVTNTGNDTLSGITVTDNQGVAVSCPGTSLAPGDSMTCRATGTAQPGAYENVGTVTASDPFGTSVTDDDPSHYTGVAPGIDVEKATNGRDADLPPGPFVPVGSPVTWTYVVTNTGNSPLTGVALTDDQLGAVTCPTTTLAPEESTTCAATGTAEAGPYENNATATGIDTLGRTVRDTDPSHYFGEAPSIDIEKSTNGEDADAPPGPLVAAGSSVGWLYEIRNTGNVPLIWSVQDDQGEALQCPRLPLLVPGESIFCSATGTARAGQYANVGSVEGTSPSGQVVTDQDPSHYFGVQAAIDLEKLTNGEDADEAPGPFIPVGAPVTWTYRVTNTGNSLLTGVDIVDLEGVAVTCPQTTLAVGETMDCTGSGTAQTGQYTNLARASGLDPVGDEVSDTDPSNYFGAAPGIHIQKLTNGVEADDPPGPFIPVGSQVTWSYVVTNTGNSTLSDVTVVDDQGVTVTCPQDALAPDEEMTCTATGTSVEGGYANTGTASGTGPTGATVTDDDPSHYFGSISAIQVQKFTNDHDADTAPGPRIPVGARVTWLYEVTNPGNVAIGDVKLVDSKGVKPRLTGGDTNEDSMIDPGETWIYTATGKAKPGQYANTATVTGLDTLETPLRDTDPSHYFGQTGPLPATGPVGGVAGFPVGGVETGTAPIADGSSASGTAIMLVALAGAVFVLWRIRGRAVALAGAGAAVALVVTLVAVDPLAPGRTPQAAGQAPALNHAAPAAESAAPAQPETSMRVVIPEIGVDSRVVSLGLNPDRTLDVPDDSQLAGWWSGGAAPGMRGAAVIVGHVNSTAGPGVFSRLSTLGRGDPLSVVHPDGSVSHFVVTGTDEYPKTQFPTRQVYGDIPYAGLRLITCGGQFDPYTGHYLDNVVVYARLAGANAVST